MRKLFTLLISTITIFALVSCNDVDTSSTTSVVTTSSSVQNTSENSNTSLETSNIEQINSSFEELTDNEERFDEGNTSSKPIESSSSEIKDSASQPDESSIPEESSSEEPSSETSIETSIQTKYHVRFVNYNNELLYEIDVVEGQEATYSGETPTKPEDDEFAYTFNGWDKDLTSIISDVTTIATYLTVTKTKWGPIEWF